MVGERAATYRDEYASGDPSTEGPSVAQVEGDSNPPEDPLPVPKEVLA